MYSIQKQPPEMFCNKKCPPPIQRFFSKLPSPSKPMPSMGHNPLKNETPPPSEKQTPPPIET